MIRCHFLKKVSIIIFFIHTIFTANHGFFYFQKFDIYPAVVRVDYIPHHVDMAALRAGQYVQLINLVPWKVNFKYFKILYFS